MTIRVDSLHGGLGIMDLNRRAFSQGAVAAAMTVFAGCDREHNERTKETGKMADMTFGKLIEARRSVRAYAPSEISREELTQIVTEALNAPSWKNQEATRYRIAASTEAKARVWKEALPSFNATSSANAAALVVVSFKKGLSGYLGDAPANEVGEMWGAYDAGLASSYFVLAAKNHGWDTLIMGIRDETALRKIFDIPADEVVLSVIALGKSAQPYFKNPRKPVGEVLEIV